MRVEFPSHGEARDFAVKLEEEGLRQVRRWKYMVVGRPTRTRLTRCDRIRAEAPADGSLAAPWRERPPSPFWWRGGLGDG